MSHKAAKLGITIAVLSVTFGALLYSSLSENLQAYKYVDEVMAEPERWEGQPLKVHGFVVPGTITRHRDDARQYRFELQRNGKVVTAHYTGPTPPDTFKDDSEVVLQGVLQGDTFVSDHMEAKCPSKYEERPSDVTGL